MAFEVVGKRYTNEEGVPLTSEGTSDITLDEQWLRNAFVLPANDFNESIDLDNRYWTSAMSKYTDGGFGCNIGINPKPQFCAYTDYPERGTLATHVDANIFETTSNYGLGGFWSTAFDDPEQIIYMRFGVPEFNSLLNFFLGAYDYGSSVLARTGRWPSFLYDVGKFLGTYAMVSAFPLIAIPILVYRTVDFLYFRQSAKFYHMKPTMHLYWGAVNNLVNTLAINSGIYPKILDGDTESTNRIGMPYKINQDDMSIYHELVPDIFTSENYIDVYAVANRAQRMANEKLYQEFNALNNGTNTEWVGYVKREMTTKQTRESYYLDSSGAPKFWSFVEHYLNFGDFYDQPTKELKAETSVPEDKTTEKPDGTKYNPLYSESTFNNFRKHLTSEFRLGGGFAIFRVDHTSSMSESFSNSTTPSALENKMNSISSNFQEHRFMLDSASAIVGDTIQGALNAATDAFMGVADGLTAGAAGSIVGMLGGGYVEIPEHWQSSSTSLPTAQYKMKLECWNASVFSRIMKMYIPFAMVAAGAWPRSVGRQSYTSPFLCQVYDRGRVQVPLGMITEFSVSRGTGNIGFTVEGAPLTMELTWTVKDLSRVLHMPLISGNIGAEPTMIDEDSTITNYLATVAGQSVYNQIYPASKAKIRAAKAVVSSGKFFSPAFYASLIHDSTTQGFGRYLTFGTAIIMEGLQRNPEQAMGSNN